MNYLFFSSVPLGAYSWIAGARKLSNVWQTNHMFRCKIKKQRIKLPRQRHTSPFHRRQEVTRKVSRQHGPQDGLRLQMKIKYESQIRTQVMEREYPILPV
uniref:Uncharacterized protein n=1 Tax=Cacopsylla melanoneura TaxID=428564 RepID=A0A8D8RCD5_9HEMI